jgi:multicomponent Na+:H+ antiporter subunit D
LCNKLYDIASLIGTKLTAGFSALSGAAARAAQKHMGKPEDTGRTGIMARGWPIGVTALWIAVLLTAYIGVYYF